MATLLRSLHRPPRITALGVFVSRRCALPPFRLAVAVVAARKPHARSLQTSSTTRNTPNATVPPQNESISTPEPASTSTGEEKMYYGPLAQTFRRLKILSVSSLALTCIFTPFLFIIETASSVPLLGRVVLAGTVLVTSSVSTALVAWSSLPYVHTLRWLPYEGAGSAPAQAAGAQPAGIELATYTLGLHERLTRVYDTAFLVPTHRPFAKWELAAELSLPPREAEAEKAKAKGSFPREETVAETLDGHGDVIGRWIVRWEEDGSGKCYQQGKVLRYFNVHEELLSRPIR